MDWLTQHFEIILPVALVLLYFFQHMFTGETGERDLPGEDDPEARRIQEEIRRKIVERQQGRSTTEEPQRQPGHFPDPEPREVQPPAFPRAQPPAIPTAAREPEPRVAYSESTYRDLEGELRAQRERVRESQKAREAAMEKTRARGQRTEPLMPIERRRSGELRGDLLDDLSTAESLRRAFVLKEILDTPVSIRERSDSFNYGG